MRHCDSLAGWPDCGAPASVRSRRGRARSAGRRRRAHGVRRLGGARLHAAPVEVPLLPPGHRPLKVLHLSDLHLTPDQRRKQEWLRRLADLEPDLVVNTGDNLAHRDAVARVLEALGAAAGRARASSSSAPTTTTRRRCATRCATSCPTTASATSTRRSSPGPSLAAALRRRAAGSTSPTGAAARRSAARRSRSSASTTRTCGYDDLAAVAGPRRTPTPTSGSGVTHAPYLRVLDQFAARRLRRDHRRPHPRRAGLPARHRRDRDQLRPRHRPRQGPAPAPGRLAGRPGHVLAARLGRRWHLAVRPDPVSPADPRRPC